MKRAFFAILFLFMGTMAFAQQKENKAGTIDPAKKVYEVEASCGQCKLGLKGKGCTLAIRKDDKAWFVDGTDINSHGDAHADDGFCNKIRKAKVQGEVVDGRFRASYFELLPEGEKKGKG